MFFPVRDRLPTRSFPFVNYMLIIANVLFYVWQMSLIEAGNATFGDAYGFVPYRFNHAPITESPTIFTAMFMHAGLAHLGGNMLTLWIFGDNVEDAVGHFRYFLFYLLGGVAAAITQMGTDPTSTIPMVGASGAIAAVMAAYLSLYPTSPITVLNPILPLWFFFGIFWEFPAWLVAAEFFVLNLLSGVRSLDAARHGMGGVAFFAHIGGFVAGLVLVRFFMAGREPQRAEKWHGWRPPERRGNPWDNSRSRQGW